MTMKFRIVKNAIRDILGNAAAGRYQVIGFQRQEKASESYKDDNRLVEVYFRTSNFDKTKSRVSGPKQASVSIAIELTTSAAAKVDLSVINNPGSTEAQLQAALASIKEASNKSDELFDELAEIVYQTVESALEIDLSLGKGIISNKFISTINKSDPNPRGQLVVLTGFLEFSCNVSEDVPGDETGLPIATIDSTININDDNIQKTGIQVNYQ